MLLALAKIMPMVTQYATSISARESSKLLFSMDGRMTEVIPSVRRVQQSFNLESLCYSAGSLKILREF